MSLATFAAKETIEFTTHTVAGRVALDAAKKGIAEVFSSIGLKRAAAGVLRPDLGLDEFEFLHQEAQGIKKGKRYIPHGEVNPKSGTLIDMHRAEITAYAEGTRKVSDTFGGVPQRMRFPQAWIDNGIFTHERTFNPSDVSSERLKANLPPLDLSKARRGDHVEIGTTGAKGEYVMAHPGTEIGDRARVKMYQNYFREQPLNSGELMPLNAKNDNQLWFTEEGAVYSSSVRGAQRTPPSESLKFLPTTRVADPKELQVMYGARELPDEIHPILQKSDALIRANVGQPLSTLYALSSAPEHTFIETPLTSWRPSSPFNPTCGSANCMASTAAVLRTLRSGALTTVKDIAQFKSKGGEFLGEPYFGRFDDVHKAIDWFKEAAGAEVVDSGRVEGWLKPGTYAITMDLGGGPNKNIQHMIFAHTFRDDRTFFYDAQSGLQLNGHSVTRPKFSPYFYKLKPAD